MVHLRSELSSWGPSYSLSFSVLASSELFSSSPAAAVTNRLDDPAHLCFPDAPSCSCASWSDDYLKSSLGRRSVFSGVSNFGLDRLVVGELCRENAVRYRLNRCPSRDDLVQFVDILE